MDCACRRMLDLTCYITHQWHDVPVSASSGSPPQCSTFSSTVKWQLVAGVTFLRTFEHQRTKMKETLRQSYFTFEAQKLHTSYQIASKLRNTHCFSFTKFIHGHWTAITVKTVVLIFSHGVAHPTFFHYSVTPTFIVVVLFPLKKVSLTLYTAYAALGSNILDHISESGENCRR